MLTSYLDTSHQKDVVKTVSDSCILEIYGILGTTTEANMQLWSFGDGLISS